MNIEPLSAAIALTAMATAPRAEDDLTQSFSGKNIEFTKVPSRVGKMVEFLHSIGSVKNKPASWKDYSSKRRRSFPEAEIMRLLC
jgi:hypothetical protein